jgi:hypothetical protein
VRVLCGRARHITPPVRINICRKNKEETKNLAQAPLAVTSPSYLRDEEYKSKALATCVLHLSPMNDSLKTLEQTRKDDAIALETAGLNLWGDDPAEILAKALIEYFGPDSEHACTVAQCAILLRNSFPLYQQLVKAHQTRSYQALVDAGGYSDDPFVHLLILIPS